MRTGILRPHRIEDPLYDLCCTCVVRQIHSIAAANPVMVTLRLDTQNCNSQAYWWVEVHRCPEMFRATLVGENTLYVSETVEAKQHAESHARHICAESA